ncbi:AfsA-related hotdog domain-containing protein [Streptomyces flaveolus]|uniref:AfsA-related hotdog domain-containing protein n=1 Tax=Streptomyces flaveolus TaxID=67297 RepID=UPI0033C8F321
MDTITLPRNHPGLAAGLSYDRTVSRDLVHRWSLSEVFLTDHRDIDGTSFHAAAQLPLSHSYYCDHLGPVALHDPLLVLEACRQSVTCAAHENQGVARSTTFMVTSWDVQIADPQTLRRGERPGELGILGRVTARQERGGRLRRLVFAMELVLDGAFLGTLTMDVTCTPTDQYHALRRMQRGSEVPTAFTLAGETTGTPAPAGATARLDPRNAVLDDLVLREGTLSALLSPRTYRNRSMYDHPYDHVPAMVFSEAARQCAQLLTGPGTEGRWLRSLTGDFQRFAELDAPVHITASVQDTGDDRACRMEAVQGATSVASVLVRLG